MKNKISAVISIIISAFLIIAVNTFWRPCHGVMAMPCEHSTRIACIVLAAVIAAGILRIISGKKLFRIIDNAVGIAGGILLIITPVFGKCQVASMACNMKTFPTLKMGGILLILVAVVSVILEILNILSRSKRHAHTF